jgi:hypothetical protein
LGRWILVIVIYIVVDKKNKSKLTNEKWVNLSCPMNDILLLKDLFSVTSCYYPI